MARDRLRRHEVDLAAERGLLFLTVEVTLGAVALQTADRARVAGAGIEVSDLLNGEHEVGVDRCRDLSRLIAAGSLALPSISTQCIRAVIATWGCPQPGDGRCTAARVVTPELPRRPYDQDLNAQLFDLIGTASLA